MHRIGFASGPTRRRVGASVRVALFLAMSTSAVQATSPVNRQALELDAFLAGLDVQCSMSPQFESFLDALREIDGEAYHLTPMAAKAQVDAVTQSAIGEIRITDENDSYQQISVNVKGTWREVPVAAFRLWLGKHNGIVATEVIFEPPSAAALQVFGPRIEDSASAMAEDPENISEASTGLDVEDGRVRLWCDWSV